MLWLKRRLHVERPLPQAIDVISGLQQQYLVTESPHGSHLVGMILRPLGAWRFFVCRSRWRSVDDKAYDVMTEECAGETRITGAEAAQSHVQEMGEPPPRAGLPGLWRPAQIGYHSTLRCSYWQVGDTDGRP